MVTIHSGHLQKSVNRVMRLPETKHKYLKRIDRKQAIIITIVMVVTMILSILFFLAKYAEVYVISPHNLAKLSSQLSLFRVHSDLRTLLFTSCICL